MVISIVSVFAVIISPIIAVWIGQFLQDRTEKRKDKMAIFRSLVSSRIYGGWTVESVNSLNLIEIVFYKDEVVCHQWRKYYEVLSDKVPFGDEQERKIQFEQNELIRVMGKTLGYNDDAITQIIRTPYIPIGMSNQMQNQQQFQKMQMTAMQAMLSSFANNSDEQ